MFDKFKEFVENNGLFRKTDKVLIGVSGGVDSVVLMQLVDQFKISFGIAHCNFKLRGSESDADEAFVAGLARINKVPYFQTSFETELVAKHRGISIEMAARDLRYEWFEEIRNANGYNWILVAHHQDDVLETFFLNLSRGTGIRGLSGIKVVSGKLVRPLLFATRSEIEDYAAKKSLIYRTDSTNRDARIPRNKIRHKILPLLEEINPAFRNNMSRTISNLNYTEEVFMQRIEQVRSEIQTEASFGTLIDMDQLRKLFPTRTYLYELISKYGFNADQAGDIQRAMGGQSGTQFLSATHRIVVDRKYLIINSVNTKVIDAEEIAIKIEALKQLESKADKNEEPIITPYTEPKAEPKAERKVSTKATPKPKTKREPIEPITFPRNRADEKLLLPERMLAFKKVVDKIIKPSKATQLSAEKDGADKKKKERKPVVKNKNFVRIPNAENSIIPPIKKKGRQPLIGVLDPEERKRFLETGEIVGTIVETVISEPIKIEPIITEIEKVEIPEKPVQVEQIEETEKVVQFVRPTKSDKPIKVGRPAKAEKPVKAEKPAKSEIAIKVAPSVEIKEQPVDESKGDQEVILIDKAIQNLEKPIKLNMTIERYSADYQIPDSPNVAVFDYFRLNGQMSLRRWSFGDTFKPIGMNNFKKLSDFFIDEKFSIPQKENTWLLCAGGQIAWVVGARIDDRFKVNPSTRMVVRIEYSE